MERKQSTRVLAAIYTSMFTVQPLFKAATTPHTETTVEYTPETNRYRVLIPRGERSILAHDWCYSNLAAHAWTQQRDLHYSPAKSEQPVGMLWHSMIFEFDDSCTAVEFALRFS